MADTKRTTTIFHNYYHFHHELEEDYSCQSQKVGHETYSSFRFNLFVRVYFLAHESQQCVITTLHADEDWQAVEGALSKDIATLGEYLQTWKLKLSTMKTVSAVFHHNNKEAKCELKVTFNNETLPFCSEPKYLRVTLDRSLTYC